MSFLFKKNQYDEVDYGKLSEDEMNSINEFDQNLYEFIDNHPLTQVPSKFFSFIKTFLFFYGSINFLFFLLTILGSTNIRLGNWGTIIIHVLPIILAYLFFDRNFSERKKLMNGIHFDIMTIFKQYLMKSRKNTN